jgi:hypothetical protein
VFLALGGVGIVTGGLVKRFVHNRTARRLMLAQVWLTMPLLLIAMVFSLLLILSIGLATLWLSSLLLGFVIGLAPWTEMYSRR